MASDVPIMLINFYGGSMNGYICMFLGKKVEVLANDLWQAKQKAISALNVPKSKQGLLSIVLAEVSGKDIIQSTAF
jgi:hypothetical protein